MHLLKKILEVFTPKSKSDIELFIESKQPKTTADVEHWIQVYNYRRH
jgi:hypothetical protein